MRMVVVMAMAEAEGVMVVDKAEVGVRGEAGVRGFRNCKYRNAMRPFSKGSNRPFVLNTEYPDTSRCESM